MLSAFALLASCTPDPCTGERKLSKTVIGAGIGAATGAAIGAATGGDRGKRAAIGAGVGALAAKGRWPYAARLSLHVRSGAVDESTASYESECRPEGPYGALK